MGITDLIAHSIDEYVELAIRACNDKQWIEPICQTIKKKSEKLLKDKNSVDEYNEKLEELYNYYIENGENMKI